MITTIPHYNSDIKLYYIQLSVNCSKSAVSKTQSSLSSTYDHAKLDHICIPECNELVAELILELNRPLY